MERLVKEKNFMIQYHRIEDSRRSFYMKFSKKRKIYKIMTSCLIVNFIFFFMMAFVSMNHLNLKTLFTNVHHTKESATYADETKESTTLTIGTNITIDEDVSVDENVKFTYVIEINGNLYNGTATSVEDEQKTYDVKNGEVSIPYNEKITIPVQAKDQYNITRKAYDKDLYALIEEEKISGVIENKYYKTENGVKSEITQEEYNQETDNGQKTDRTKYVDMEGNNFEEAALEERNGFEVKKNNNISTTYNFETYGPQKMVKDSLKTYAFKIQMNSTFTSTKTGFITMYKYNGSISAETDYDINVCQDEANTDGCILLKDTISESSLPS